MFCFEAGRTTARSKKSGSCTDGPSGVAAAPRSTDHRSRSVADFGRVSRWSASSSRIPERGRLGSVLNSCFVRSECLLCGGVLSYPVSLYGAFGGSFPVYMLRVQLPALNFDQVSAGRGRASVPCRFRRDRRLSPSQPLHIRELRRSERLRVGDLSGNDDRCDEGNRPLSSVRSAGMRTPVRSPAAAFGHPGPLGRHPRGTDENRAASPSAIVGWVRMASRSAV